MPGAPGFMTSFHALRWDDDVRRFFKALVPATIGSAGTQLALFADTIIASFLSAGALSALYYADRIDQLPIGVIGIAVGTVLVPEMTSRVAAGDEAGARAAQSRAIEFALLLALPCVVAFLVLPDLIMRGLFMRGRFTADDAHAAAMTLVAYTIGLIPFILVRSVVAPFLARGDTATPVKAALTGTAVNIVCKIALMGSLAQIGLALATSIGAWINFVLVLWFARREGLFGFDAACGPRSASSRSPMAPSRSSCSSRPPSSPPCYRRGLASAIRPNSSCWRCSAACSMERWSRRCSGGNGFRACASARERRPRRPARRSRARLPRPPEPDQS